MIPHLEFLLFIQPVGIFGEQKQLHHRCKEHGTHLGTLHQGRTPGKHRCNDEHITFIRECSEKKNSQVATFYLIFSGVLFIFSIVLRIHTYGEVKATLRMDILEQYRIFTSFLKPRKILSFTFTLDHFWLGSFSQIMTLWDAVFVSLLNHLWIFTYKLYARFVWAYLWGLYPIISEIFFWKWEFESFECLDYTRLNQHSNGNWTIWNLKMYVLYFLQWGFSIAMLVCRRVLQESCDPHIEGIYSV